MITCLTTCLLIVTDFFTRLLIYSDFSEVGRSRQVIIMKTSSKVSNLEKIFNFSKYC